MGHVNQKGASGQKAPAAGQKVAPGGKGQAKGSSQKPSAQKGQVKVTPKSASVKTGKNKKKGQRQQYDLIVTINLVSGTYNSIIRIANHAAREKNESGSPPVIRRLSTKYLIASPLFYFVAQIAI